MSFVPVVEIPTVQPIKVEYKANEFTEAPDELVFNDDLTVLYVEHIKTMCERFNLMVASSIDFGLVQSMTLNCSLFVPDNDWRFDVCHLIYQVRHHFGKNQISVVQRLYSSRDSSDYIDSESVVLDDLLGVLTPKNKF